jgi:hypothetical protein
MPAMRSILGLAAAVAVSAFAGAGMPTTADSSPVARTMEATKGVPKHGSKTPTSPEQRAAWLRTRGSRARGGYPKPGWTVAHDRRMARKRRNVIKARRAARG